MRKRAICFLLSAVIVFGMICPGLPKASAVSDMNASEACISLIKKLEGFVSRPYYDYNQWSVGYGTRCPEEDRVRYQTYGITTAEADALLREYVDGFETKLNAFTSKYHLSLKQHQFDALISFTYNLGSDWMNNESTFRTAVLNGASGNDFLFAIGRWCTANGEILESLIKRRLAEANLYLNGVYSTAVPSNYRYVIFDNVLEKAVNDVRVQAYDSTRTSVVRASPSKTGYHFLGWYDAAEGGAPVTTLNANTAVSKVYAHWQGRDSAVDEKGNVTGTAAKYRHTISNSGGQVVREEPSLNAEETDKLEQNETVTIVADYLDENNIRWAKLSTGGWINMSDADSGDDSSVVILNEPVVVTVINSYVNIRSGAGTGYTKLGTANGGDQLTITKTKVVNGETWGKFTGGWICLTYTDFGMAMEEDSAVVGVVTATGVVNVEKLNVRAGTGTQYAIVGSLYLGDQVEITQQKTIGVMSWGKISTGWICLSYVDMTPVSGETTEDSDKKEEETAVSGEVIATGTVVNCNSLRIRSGAGTGNAQVGSLACGTRVEIYEKASVGSQTWGRISSGWICLTSYVQLDSAVSDVGTMGTVVNCSALNVRAGAGTGYGKVGRLPNGSIVEILETVQANGATWGRTDQGWVHMYYIQLDHSGTESSGAAAPETPSTGSTAVSGMNGTVVGTDALRIRSAPGIQNAKVGTLTGGTRVTILETAMVGSTTWGRISQGWISLYYVELDTDVAGTVKTVTADSLNIRSGAGTSNAKVGTYTRGAQVTILETKLVGSTLWGRTDRGWISLDYVK